MAARVAVGARDRERHGDGDGDRDGVQVGGRDGIAVARRDAVDDGDADSGEIIIPSKPSAKADAAKPVTAKPAVTKTAAKAEPATSAVPPDVEELMSDWGG